MDKNLLATLKSNDEELKSTLSNCLSMKEAWHALKLKEKSLDEEIDKLGKEVDPQKLLNELHRYNYMKDAAQSVIGSLANLRGVTVTELHKEFNLEME